MFYSILVVRADQVMLATRQSYYLERIIRSFQKVLKGSDDAEVAAENFGQDVDLFGEVLNGHVRRR